MSSEQNGGGRSASFVTASVVIHVLAISAVALLPALKILPLGLGGEDITTNFEIIGDEQPPAATAATPAAATKPSTLEVAKTLAPAPTVKPTVKDADQEQIAAMARSAENFASRNKPKTKSIEEQVWSETAEKAASQAVDDGQDSEDLLPAPKLRKASDRLVEEDTNESDEPASKLLPVVPSEAADSADDKISEVATIQESENALETDQAKPAVDFTPAEDRELVEPLAATAPSATAAPTNSGRGAADGAPGSLGAPTRSYLDLKQAAGNRPPLYPVLARRNGWQGEVVLNYYVTSSGAVENVSVARSSGYPILDQEASRSVSKFRFVPGQAGWTSHPVKFNLTGEAASAPSRLRSAGQSTGM